MTNRIRKAGAQALRLGVMSALLLAAAAPLGCLPTESADPSGLLGAGSSGGFGSTMKADASRLNFGSNLASMKFAVQRVSGGTLSYTASATESWVTIGPKSGLLVNAPVEFNVDIDRNALGRGTHSAIITVQAGGAEPVVVNVEATVGDPLVATSPSGGAPGSDGLSSNTDLWNSTVPGNDSPNADSGKDDDGKGGGNGGDEFDVPMASDPLLLVTPERLDFGKKRSELWVQIRATAGPTEFQIASSVDWVSLSTAHGVVGTDPQRVDVRVDRDRLNPGEYSGLLTVTAGGRPQGVVVLSLEVGLPGLSVMPWVECNWTNMYPSTVEGLRIWSAVSDTAIVSTTPNHAYFYSNLKNDVPGMRVIPGLKTLYLLDAFDSVENWQAVADEVAAIRAASGEAVILLDSERILEKFVGGLVDINLDRLEEGLSLLPGDVEYIWFPSIFDPSIGDGNGIPRSTAVCEVVERTLANVRYIDQRYCSRGALRHPLWIQSGQILDSLSGRPTLPMLYFMGEVDGYIWWEDAQLPQALDLVRNRWGSDAEVVVYTGASRWMSGSQSLVGLLSGGLD